MTDLEHLARLKEGWEAWNEWRQSNPGVVFIDLHRASLSGADLYGRDLHEADLREANLSEANLSDANLYGVNLSGANLSGARLRGTNLTRANLSEADLSRVDLSHTNLAEANLHRTKLSDMQLWGANLGGADLSVASLRGANLSGAMLRGANLSRANLVKANLRSANLVGARLNGALLNGADLSKADLSEADLSEAQVNNTVFGDTNLSRTKGLESCNHKGPSMLDHATLFRSSMLPEPFLRGCGLPDVLITLLPSLLNQAIQFYSCFISYSTKDQEFAERLHADLQNKGIRCWFAPHDMAGGKKIHEQMDEAIRIYDRLLLILSDHSMGSNWIKTEISKARKRERSGVRRMLFPVRLVGFESLQKWECFDADTGKDSAREIREYFIPDFSHWKDHDAYKLTFDMLLRDLKAPATQAASHS